MELTEEQLGELHTHMLELLKIFDKFCKENNLKYYLIAGSALGAVRHGGFIPWDDDMDIGLPRQDYDKFLRLFPAQGIGQAVLKTNNKNRRDHVYPWAKLEDKTTRLVVEWHRHLNPDTGVFIDIFPIDGAPDSKSKQLKHVGRIDILRILLKGSYRQTVKNFVVRRAVWRMIRNNFARGCIMKILDIISKKYSFETCSYVGVLLDEFGMREIMDKDIYGEPKEIQFEGFTTYVPSKTEMYLTKIYGEDWNHLPPVEKRLPHSLAYLSFEK